jgi:hypothetical protein
MAAGVIQAAHWPVFSTQDSSFSRFYPESEIRGLVPDAGSMKDPRWNCVQASPWSVCLTVDQISFFLALFS